MALENARKDFYLDGKTAIVTGAGRGIGKGIALALARYGANLAIWSRTRSELDQLAGECKSMGIEVLPQTVDVTDTAALSKSVQAVVDRFGRIDIMVNNAGMNVPQWAEEVTESAWDQVMAVNLKGAFFCAQAVGRIMIAQKSGKIINVSSQAGSVGMIRRAAYCASKGAINQITRVLAVEWAKHGISVNAIAPTFVETEMTQKSLEDKAFNDYVFGNILFDRLARPEDVVGGVIYLASNAADMVTGHILHVDGGWTVH